MGVLTCGCLNVSIHYKGALWTERSLSSNHIFPKGAVDPLTNQPLYEIELDVAGIVVEHKALVVPRNLGDWVIHTCTNCETDVYVVHLLKELSRVFVTSNLVFDGAKLRGTEEYSQVFKIVLRGDVEAAEIDGYRRKRLSSMTFGKEDQAFSKVHGLMKDFLNHEQAAMEERVRKYEDDQRSAFAELQERAHRDRALLFAAINRAAEKDPIGASISSTTSTTSTTSTIPQRASPKKLVTVVQAPKHSSPLGDVTITMPPKAPNKVMGGANSDDTVTGGANSDDAVTGGANSDDTVTGGANSDDAVMGGANSDDTADFFMLEGYGDEGNRSGAETSAFLQSSDDETSTDDSSYRDDSAIQAMASSLPVNMQSSRRGTRDDILNVRDQFDPQEVGASIRALALSVQDTGMFGDLPKPRIDCRPHAR